jgi:acyl dehydratase
MTTILDGAEGIRAKLGKHLGPGPYVLLTQERINQFAEATGDRQWIHVDESRAKDGPYGKTIAHGLLTLSMISELNRDVFRFSGFKMGLNYGYQKVRFPAPAPVGSRLRLSACILAVEDVPKAIQTTLELTVEIEGREKPACVAEMIFRHYP